MAEPPDLRASDADRERVAVRLRDAAGDGQLTIEELDERLQAAYAAWTHGELEPLVADLQAPRAAAAPVAHEGGYSVRPGPGGARWLFAIMGGCSRKGRWRLGEQATVLNVMGGADLDLNQVELASDHVELNVISIMGGSDIYVPNGLNVDVTEFAFMGANEIRIDDEHARAPGPVLHLRIFSLMGGTDVKRGPKLTRAERREMRRTHRAGRRELRRAERFGRRR